MLVSPSDIGLNDNFCYMAVFKSGINYSFTWMIGNQFMRKYYIVYDQTPYDEQGQDYIQIGFAEQNDLSVIGINHYGAGLPHYTPEARDLDSSVP